MHHKFGSLHLIETIHGLGYSIPYDEVRCYDGIYLPRGIAKYEKDDLISVIDAAVDNFHQIEETIDGLAITHCMAAVYKILSNGIINGIP